MLEARVTKVSLKQYNRREEMYVPVQLLRLRDGFLCLMHCETRDEWLLWVQDNNVSYAWVSDSYKSRGMSSYFFQLVADELTAQEREDIVRKLDEEKLSQDDRLAAIEEFGRLEVADDDFEGKEKYQAWARKVQEEETAGPERQ